VLRTRIASDPRTYIFYCEYTAIGVILVELGVGVEKLVEKRRPCGCRVVAAKCFFRV